jgi:predicted nucleic acid-binding Zn ribbon protein
MQWPKDKRRKDRQYNDQKINDERTDLVIVLSVLSSFIFWSLYCLSFRRLSFGHCIVCKRRKDRQYNDQKINDKGQTIQWPKDKRQKDRQYNDQKINDESTDNTMVCSFVVYLLVIVLSVLSSLIFWSLYCLSFRRLSFGHCIVCTFVIQWPKDKRRKDRQYNDQKINDERTDNTMIKR